MKDNSKETTNIETTNINNPEQKISRKEQQKLD
jgi:hypothetical protein